MSFSNIWILLSSLISLIGTDVSPILIHTAAHFNADNKPVYSINIHSIKDNGETIILKKINEIRCQTYTTKVANLEIQEKIEMHVRSISYDSSSELLLIQTKTKDESRFTLLLANPCANKHTTSSENFKNSSMIRYSEKGNGSNCKEITNERNSFEKIFDKFSKNFRYINRNKNKLSNKLTNSSELRLLYKDSKSLEYGHVGPVAMHDKEIYFVLQTFDLSQFGDKQSIVQIRKLKSKCGMLSIDYPVLETDSIFDLMECSQLVSELVKEAFEETHAYRPMNDLLLIPAKNCVHLFLQVIKIKKQLESIETTILLYHVSNVSEQASIVNEKVVDSSFLKYYLFQLGGISYKGEYICWSMIDQVLCGRWNKDRLTRIRVHLRPGQASAACEAPSTEDYLANVVTGLSVVEASIGKEIKVLFGCIAQIPSFGGLGLLSSNEAGKTIGVVKKILDVSGVSLQAGMLHLVEGCVMRSNKAAIVTLTHHFLLLSTLALRLFL